MAITVADLPVSGFVKEAGITTGNEFIYAIPRNVVALSIHMIEEAAGTCNVKRTMDSAAPTDFSAMLTTNASALTEDTIETLTEVPAYVGVDVATGTWTVIIRARYSHDAY